MNKNLLLTGIISSAMLLSSTAIAEENYVNGDLVDSSEAVRAFKDGEVKIDFRLRHENAKQDQLKTAKATTLRSQIAFATAKDCDLQFQMSLVDVSNFFGRKYDTGVSALSQPNYSLVADPKGTGLTNILVKYKGIQDTIFTLGRQFISIENGRFIGKRDFRQFPQSFDALTVENKSLQDTSLTYSYIDHVNTTNASSRDSEGRRKLRTHLLNVNWDGAYYNAIDALFLLNKDKTTAANSNLILALTLRASNDFQEVMGFEYHITAAQQQAKYNNPNKYKANYWSLGASKVFNMIEVAAGYERLSGKNTNVNQAFKMPLGDYHSFLGLADAFVNTPSQGVQDIHFGVKAEVPNTHLKIGAQYHNFRFAETVAGSKKIGHEYDVFGNLILNDNLSVDFTLAQFYSRTNLVPKTRRVSVSLNAHV